MAGGAVVAEVEADGAPERHPVVHGHRPGRTVHPDHVPDEEVARSRIDQVLVDEPTQEQAADLLDLPRRQFDTWIWGLGSSGDIRAVEAGMV